MKKIAFLLTCAASLCFAKTTAVTSANYQSFIQSAPNVILDCYADWCGPCKQLGPVYEQVSGTYSSDYQFGKVNANEGQLIQKLNIGGFPTLIFYKNGKEVARSTGSLSADKLKSKIDSIYTK